MNFTKEDVARKILEHVDYYLHFAEVGTDADQRNYEVSYEKIRKKGFETTDRPRPRHRRAGPRGQADRVPEPVRQRLIGRGSRRTVRPMRGRGPSALGDVPPPIADVLPTAHCRLTTEEHR